MEKPTYLQHLKGSLKVPMFVNKCGLSTQISSNYLFNLLNITKHNEGVQKLTMPDGQLYLAVF